MKPLNVGQIAIVTVEELSAVPLRFAEFLPASSAELIERERSWLEPRFADLSQGVGLLCFQSYCLRTPHHTIIVDTCIGNDKDRNGHPGFHRLHTRWLQNLAAAGIDPAAVDFVMCTHMHGDHIGWNTRLDNGHWVPTFPNARYLFARTEFEHRRRAYDADRGAGFGAFHDSVLPVVESGQAVIVDDAYALDDMVRLEPAPGHTPGNVVIQLRSANQSAVLCGDVIHHPIQVVYPEWSAAFCEDPRQSGTTRRNFVEAHCELGTLVLPAHFAAPTAGRIRRSGPRWRFEFLEGQVP